MRLVEILARELVEWPDGAAIVVQDYDGEVKYQFSNEEPEIQSAAVWIRPPGGEPNDGMMFRAILASDHTTAIVTREMWEAERAKLASTAEWNGEGLPPVGSVCEGREYGEWSKVEVIAHYEGRAVCMLSCKERVALADPGQLRPVIRTPEQVAAQDREESIDKMVGVSPLLDKAWSRTVCAALYDAGYRKQEQSE